MTLWLQLVLAVLAVWRVTHLLAAEDGPGDILAKLRARLGRSFAGQLMDCFYCLSLWTAAPAALYVTRNWLDWLMTWLALSGAACLLERLGGSPVVMQPMTESVQGDSDHVLRTEAGGDGEAGERSEAHYHEHDHATGR